MAAKNTKHKMKNNTNKKYNFLINFGLVLLSAIVVCIFFEIGFRIFTTQSTPFVQFSPIFGWEHIPNKSGYWTEELEEPVFVRINSKKLRDREFSYSKKDGVFRILMIGDSFTEAFQVPLKNTVAKVLESLLNTRQKDRRFEVISTGVGGYGAGQEFLYLKHEGFKYNPDLVMVNFFANDVCESVTLYGGRRPTFSIKDGKLKFHPPHPPPPKIVRIIKRTILTNSYLLFWVKERIKQLLLDMSGASLDGNDYVIVAGFREVGVDFPVALEITKLLESEIAGFSSIMKAKFMIFMVPSPYQLFEYFPDNMKRNVSKEVAEAKNDDLIFNEMTSYFEKRDILYINPLEEFKAHAAQQELLYLGLPGHWTIEGNRLAAEIMYDFLIENQLIK